MSVATYVAPVAVLAFALGPSSPAQAPTAQAWKSDAAVELPRMQAPTPAPVLSVDDLPTPWRQLAACESSGRVDAVGGGGRWHGLFQIEFPRTWAAHGGDPKVMPSAASVAEQWAVALHIYEDRGYKPWPHCGKYLLKAYGR